jgi:hypothetical protein
MINSRLLVMALILGMCGCGTSSPTPVSNPNAQPADLGKEEKLVGTLMCGSCTLNVTARCTNALQVKEGDKVTNYFIDDKGNGEDYHEGVCGDGKIEGVTVTGTVSEKDGNKWIKATKIDLKGPAKVGSKDIRDKVFVLSAKMDGERPVVRIEKKEVALDQIAGEMKRIIESTGRNQMVLDIDKDVPWAVETVILDAAKGNGVHEIINNRRR